MKRRPIKLVFVLAIAFLAFAVSPVSLMVCKMAMADCFGCCPEMLKAEKPTKSAQVASENTCCVFLNQTTTNTVSIQKSDPQPTAKFLSLVLHGDSAGPMMPADILSPRSSLDFPAIHPPLFLIKSSLLI